MNGLLLSVSVRAVARLFRARARRTGSLSPCRLSLSISTSSPASSRGHQARPCHRCEEVGTLVCPEPGPSRAVAPDVVVVVLGDDDHARRGRQRCRCHRCWCRCGSQLFSAPVVRAHAASAPRERPASFSLRRSLDPGVFEHDPARSGPVGRRRSSLVRRDADGRPRHCSLDNRAVAVTSVVSVTVMAWSDVVRRDDLVLVARVAREVEHRAAEHGDLRRSRPGASSARPSSR